MFEEKNVKPMLLKEIKEIVSGDYIYELKFDGIRVIVYVSKTELVIKSRNGVVLTDKYPELQSLKKKVGNKKVIFDGELIIFSDGKPDFLEVMKRNQVKDKFRVPTLAKVSPVTLVVFDVLYENKPIVDLPWYQRREILDKYPDDDFLVKSQVYFKGEELFRLVKKQGLEGIVAKRRDSKYLAGKRVDTWVKIKNVREEYFYVHGYVFNKDKYSLFLGEWRDGELHYVGKVSLVPKKEILKKIMRLKKGKNRFVNYDGEGTFISPQEKILVSYLERTKDNHLRHPRVK